MASAKLLSNSENSVLSQLDYSPTPKEDKNSLHFSNLWKPQKKKGLEVTETTNGVKVQTDKPHLVSLGGGRLSTAVTLLPLPEGKTKVGTARAPVPQDIVIQGTGIEPEHCLIENTNGTVMLYPLATMVAVDGYIISKPTRLSQGCMICLGRSNYFRFNHPEEAEFMKSLMPNTRISVAPIQFNADCSSDSCRSTSTPSSSSKEFQPVVPTVSSLSPVEKRDQPIHLYRDELESGDFVEKVSKFEFLAHSQQSPVTSDPNRWFVRDGIRHHSSSTSSSSSLSYVLPTSQPSGGSSKVLTDNDIPLGTSASLVSGCPRTVGAASKKHKVESSSSSVNTSGVPKFAPLTKIDAKISPKVFVPMIVPPAVKPNHSSPPSTITPHHYGRNINSLKACQQQLEQQHQKVVQERIHEQELEQQEQQRLEEILNMCAEYERQNMKEIKGQQKNVVTSQEQATKQDTQAESPKLSPSHSLHMNRIKTNGSLPRDRVPKPLSPGEHAGVVHCKAVKSTSSEDELNKIFNFESHAIAQSPNQETDSSSCTSPPGYSTYPQSPRTRIKTVVNREKLDEICESRLATSDYHLESEGEKKQPAPIQPKQFTSGSSSLLRKDYQEIEVKNNLRNSATQQGLSEQICPLDDVFIASGKKLNSNSDNKSDMGTQDLMLLRRRRFTTAKHCAELKRRAMNLDAQEDEAVRELEMERALLEGEYQDLLEKQRDSKEKIATLKMKEQGLVQKAEVAREQEKAHIENARLKLELEEAKLKPLESALDSQPEGSPERELIIQHIARQHEIADFEKKNFEDLEFRQLEHDAHREEEREQILQELARWEASYKARLDEIREIERQKEEMKKQIQNEVINIQTERQMLLSYYEREKQALLSIEKKLQGLELSATTASQDSDTSPRSSLSEGEAELRPQYSIVSLDDSFNTSNKKSQGDLILQVTSTSPILNQDEVVGEKATATLKRIEQNRQLILEKRGGLVIEKERKRVLQLKKAAADEVRSQWEEKKREANCNSFNSIESEASSVTSSDVLPESLSSEEYTDKMTDLDLCPSSPDDEKLELRRQIQRREAELEQNLEESRPLSPSSTDEFDVKYRDRGHVKQQRPLTRYLPILRDDFNLKQHVESAGHQIELCPHIHLSATACRGYLYKLGTKFRTWNKRWFVFDRSRHMLLYYSDKSESRPRGGICFQYITEVYVDHLRSVKSPNPKLMFCLKTIDRTYYLVAPSAEAMRIWIDVIFTGAEGYQEFPLDS